MAEPSAQTAVAGIVGWPVGHSVSPAVYNAAFRALGLDWVYVAFPVPPGRLPEAVAGLRALGVAGANVTMPHKEEAALACDRLSPEADRLRAVNTLVRSDDALVGHNTDGGGFRRFLEADVGFDPAGRTAVIFGAGGAARACALALAEAGAVRLAVAVRDPGKTGSLRRALEGTATEVATVPLRDAPRAVAQADLVVNATPLGQAGERLPVGALRAEQTVVDLLYRPPVTPLLEEARAAGARAHGGLGMLLHQAALAFELWTGRVPPLPEMSAAAVADLSRPLGVGAG